MTNLISSSYPAAATTPKSESGARLWIEFGTSIVAWLSLNCLNSIVAWRACVHQEPFGGPSPHPGARAVFFAIWFILFGTAVTSGFMSYRTWRRLSGAKDLLSAEGRERREYMSLCGLFITFTLGCGFLWLCLPLFLIQMCLRTR